MLVEDHSLLLWGDIKDDKSNRFLKYELVINMLAGRNILQLDIE